MKKSQRERIKEILLDGKPHSSVELLNRVYKVEGHSGLARIPSRIHELREEGYEIECRRGRIQKSVFYYLLRNAPAPKKKMVPIQKFDEQGRPAGVTLTWV